MKNRVDDLAIFGGPPAFQEKLHVGRPNIGNRDAFLSRMNDILDRKWLTNRGLYVREFEKKLADYMNAKHCICTCNGTIALEIAIRALNLTGQVIIPSFTFVATAHALQWQEIMPIFCDILPDTYNIDPDNIEKWITPKTTGIMGVHLWGRPCDIERLTKIANDHHLKVIFDAAHAFGCSYKGKMIGSFDDLEIFSFHATKLMNSFEGGAIVTNNDELAEKIRLMTNFGFKGQDNVIYIGINGKMSEVSAAMGLTSLENLQEFIKINRKNYQWYHEGLSGIEGLKIASYDEHEKSNYQYIVIEIDPDIVGVSRDQLVKILHAENIIARRYFYPGCHRMEPYRSLYPNTGLFLPHTERIADRIIVLPTGTGVDYNQITNICHVIKFVLQNAEIIKLKNL